MPDADVPLLTNTDPDTPDDAALLLEITTLPEPELVLDPDVTIIEPPVPVPVD